MGAKRSTVGFDRKIQLSWLDATADWAAQGLRLTEIRARLVALLEGEASSSGHRDAREKTMTVLLHVWVRVPRVLQPLRDDGLILLQEQTGRGRLALHWGMCVATYPFFRDIAATTGRLLGLQGTAALSQISRRTTETWGDRSTVNRAVQRVVRSFTEWGILEETKERGVFGSVPRFEIRDEDPVSSWMIEAAISNCGSNALPLRSLLASPALFPFRLDVTPRHVAKSPRLELHHQDPNEDIVTLKTSDYWLPSEQH
jgi:hypothetical protein